jgi:beta-lactamase regulating signal transducer with metallopeptidase domain
MLEFLRHSIAAERIGWTLVHSLWQFVLIALVAFALHRALQRLPATVRYWALLAAMVVMVAVPVATWLSLWSVETPAAAARLDAAEPRGKAPGMHHPDAPVAMEGMPATSPVSVRQSPLLAAEPGAIDLVSFRSKARQLIEPRLLVLVLIWLVGVLLAALRPLLSWYTMCRLRTVGVCPADPVIREMRDRVARRLRLARAVEVLQSTWVQTPMVVGCFRPVVLLPLSVVTGLPAVQLELILAHELAHVRRHDCLINLLQTLVETVFFYHPAVWWLSRQIRNEREHCCDDVAMGLLGCRADYGRALLAIEELRAASSVLSLAARGGLLMARIRRIAGHEPAPRFAGAGSALGVVLLSLAMYVAATAEAAPPEEKLEPTPAASPVQDTPEVDDPVPPPSQDAPPPKELWSLTLKGAISYALKDAQKRHQIGTVTVAQQILVTADSGLVGTIVMDSPTAVVPGGSELELVARLCTDTPLPDFEMAVRDLVRDVEIAYWELCWGHRKLDAAVQGRDRALKTWREIHALYTANAKGGEASKETLARQQYYLFRGAVEEDLRQLDKAEQNLRSLLGLAANDGRVIRPSDEPTTAKISFDWPQTLNEALCRSPEMRQVRWLVKQRELELAAAKEYMASHYGDEVTDGVVNVSIGLRRDMAGVRNAQLSLARDRSVLQERELELSHQLASAIRELYDSFKLTETQCNRRRAAEDEVKAVQTAYEQGTVTFDLVLLAQQRLVEAESAYHRSLIDYNEAIANVHYRKGSLLEYHGAYLAEGLKKE